MVIMHHWFDLQAAFFKYLSILEITYDKKYFYLASDKVRNKMLTMPMLHLRWNMLSIRFKFCSEEIRFCHISQNSPQLPNNRRNLLEELQTFPTSFKILRPKFFRSLVLPNPSLLLPNALSKEPHNFYVSKVFTLQILKISFKRIEKCRGGGLVV